jgi:hypothetical protein
MSDQRSVNRYNYIINTDLSSGTLLQAILGMATFSSHGSNNSSGSSSSGSSSSSSSSKEQLCNIEPVRKLLHWLTVTEYENHDQQETL